MTVSPKTASLPRSGAGAGSGGEDVAMWLTRIAGVLLIAAGALGLAYGKFSYTRDTHRANIAGFELSLKDKDTVEVPAWVAGSSVAAGTLLLLLGRRK